MILAYSLFFILGACFGSFLYATCLRLRSGKNFTSSRSECPACHKTLSPFELIPIFSFLFLGGKCRHCRKKIPWSYPAVEIILGFLFAFVWYYHESSGLEYPTFLVRDLFLLCVLSFIFLYDLLYKEILVNFVLLVALAWFMFDPIFLHISWTVNALLAAGIAGGFFALQYFLSKGKWIGAGDIYLGILMGVVLGYPQILVALFLAYVSGALITLGLLLFSRGKFTRKTQIPFGTFLSVATFVVFLYGEIILSWYRGLY